MSAPSSLDAAGRRRSPATMPGYHLGRPPRSKGMRYPADPPRVEEIVAIMRQAGEGVCGDRLRGLVVVLWRAGLRIQEALELAERHAHRPLQGQQRDARREARIAATEALLERKLLRVHGPALEEGIERAAHVAHGAPQSLTVAEMPRATSSSIRRSRPGLTADRRTPDLPPPQAEARATTSSVGVPD
jgi:hypothetical protein